MLAVGGLAPPPAPPFTKPNVSNKPLNAIPVLSIQICKTYLFPISTLSVRRSGLCLFAQRKHRNGGAAVLDSKAGSKEEDDVDDFDVEDDDFEDEDENYEEDEDADDELDVIVPLEELDEWLQRKPRGFGEGKVYDTSIEDGLLEEIDHIRKAQLANISKLKSLSLEHEKQLRKDAEAVSTGACVRISHLPKKRNIHRDLNTAFKGISGIVNIMPVVFGNKKTKDPICKGLAFVNFKSLEDAKRFNDIFSIQNITFGKIDKRIKCEIVDSANTASHNTRNNPNVGGENKADSADKSGLSLLDDEDGEEKSWDMDSGDEDDAIRESFKSLIASELAELDDADRTVQKTKTAVVSQPSKRGDNPEAAVKVKSAQKKREKNKVAKIPGAAQRLKLREKAMLADVYSRYGSRVASASKES